MIEFDVNPKNASDRYLSALNDAFAGWGDAERYHWAFERDAGAGPADIMVLREGEEWLAGSAVSYRKVRHAEGVTFTVGIMTGSWTRQTARGRGLFSRMIEESCELVARRAGAHLVAFVTHDNASRRRLEAAGSWMIPTHYVFSNDATVPPSTGVRWKGASEEDVVRLYSVVDPARDGQARFVYPTERDFRGQYLARPDRIRVLATEGADLAVVEEVASTDRLLLLIPAATERQPLIAGLWARAKSRSRAFFYFSSQTGEEQTVGALGLERRGGFFTILPVDDGSAAAPPLPLRAWRIESGDRM